jgi:type I restriction enzyme S subunit
MKQQTKLKPTENKFSEHSSKMKQTEIGMIPEDWEVKELKETASYITEKISLVEINLNNFISTENMLPEKGGITVASSLPKVGKVTQFREGDILFSNIRTYFKKFWLAKFSGGCSNDVLVIRKKSSINNKYLYYYLSQDNFFEFTVLTSKGTKMPRGDKNSIMSYEINIPSFPEQIAIAKILSDLDLKIELNQKINKVLEELSRAIFKRWFIDFEFQNEKGKPYKSTGGEMVDSELGKIPKGWKIGMIHNIATQNKEQINPVSSPEEIFSHLSIEAYDGGKTSFDQRGSEILSNKFIVTNMSVLFSKLNPRIPRIWPVINAKEKSICSTEFLVFKPNKSFFCYLYLLFKEHSVLGELVQMARGTSGSHQRISASDILDMSIIVPSKEVISKFEDSIIKIMLKCEDNINTQNILSQIRDSLLPRLISGKIRVPVEVRAWHF